MDAALPNQEEYVMEEGNYCQSCGMPLSEEVKGTNADGTKNAEYCRYCYDGGNFLSDCTMEEMINTCVPFMVEEGMKEADARKMMQALFPTLKRWQKESLEETA